MRILLLTMGKTDIRWVAEGLEMYSSRLVHYVPFSVKELPELKGAGSLRPEQIKQKEGEALFLWLEEPMASAPRCTRGHRPNYLFQK